MPDVAEPSFNTLEQAFDAIGDIQLPEEVVEKTTPQVEPEAKPEPTPEAKSDDLDMVDALEKFLSKEEKGEEKEEEKEEKEAEAEEKETAEEDEDVRGMDPKAGRKFKELKAELKVEREAKAELQRQLDEALAKTGEQADGDVATKLKRLEELEQRAAVQDIEATAEFQKTVREPLLEIVGFVEAVADKYEMDARAIVDALSIPDEAKQSSALEELLVGVSDRDRLKIYQAANDMPHILAKQQQLKDNAAEALKELRAKEEQETQRTVAQRKADREKALDSTWAHLESKLPLLQEVRDELRPVIAKLKTDARASDIDAAPDNIKAFSTYAALLLPVLVKEQALLQKQLGEAKTKIRSLSAAEPGAGASAGAKKIPAVPESADLADALEAFISTEKIW